MPSPKIILHLLLLRKVQLELGTVYKDGNSTNRFEIYRHVILTCHTDTFQVLFNNVCINNCRSLTCTTYTWCSYRSLVVTLAREVVFRKMPSCNQMKRSRMKYLQKQDENKVKARAFYKAIPENNKTSVSDHRDHSIKCK